MGRNVLLYIILFQCLSSTLHRVLLHLLRHIGILDYGLSVTHGYLRGEAEAKELGVWAAGAISPVHSARPTPPRDDDPPTPLLRKREPREQKAGEVLQGTKLKSGAPEFLTKEQGLADCNGLLGEGLAKLTPV